MSFFDQLGSHLGSIIGTAGGYYLGGPAGAAVGAQIGGGIDANSASAASTQNANDFSREQFSTRYQTTVNDMRAAGLNPMLAYSQGGGSPPSGQSYTSQNIAAGVPAGVASVASANHSTASANQANAQVGLINSTVDKVKQETANLSVEQDKARATIEILREQYQNTVKEGFNLTEQGNVMRSTIQQITANVQNINYDTLLKAAQEILTNLNAKLAGYDVKAASDMGNAGRSMGQLKPFFDILTSILRSAKR